MCDPMTIIGTVLTGASAAANAAAQSKVENARSDAMAAERIRQQGFDREADAVNARAQGQYEGFEGKQDERKSQLADFFKAQTAAPADQSGPVALPQSSSNVTVQAENKAREDARAFTDKQGEALGELRAFGDLLGTMSRGTARDAGYIGQIGSFKKGSSGVLPFELEAANSKGRGAAMLGDILGGLGRIGVSAGLSGANPFGMGAPAANSVAAFGTAPTRALGGALDRASMPGYSAQSAGGGGLFSLFRG